MSYKFYTSRKCDKIVSSRDLLQKTWWNVVMNMRNGWYWHIIHEFLNLVWFYMPVQILDETSMIERIGSVLTLHICSFILKMRINNIGTIVLNHRNVHQIRYKVHASSQWSPISSYCLLWHVMQLVRRCCTLWHKRDGRHG